MSTIFATQNGFVTNNAVVGGRPVGVRLTPAPHAQSTGTVESSGLGGQLGELAAAINAVGWNHNQVPVEERLPPQERL